MAIKIHSTKAEYMIVSKKRNRTIYPNLYLNEANITATEHHTHLGVWQAILLFIMHKKISYI